MGSIVRMDLKLPSNHFSKVKGLNPPPLSATRPQNLRFFAIKFFSFLAMKNSSYSMSVP